MSKRKKITSIGELRVLDEKRLKNMGRKIPSMAQMEDEYEKRDWDAYEARGDYQRALETGRNPGGRRYSEEGRVKRPFRRRRR